MSAKKKRFGLLLFVFVLVAAVMSGCPAAPGKHTDIDAAPGDGGGDGTSGCVESSTRCNGNNFQRCVAGQYVDVEVCAEVCDDQLGCVHCSPGTGYCDGDTSMVCTPDGTGYAPHHCDPVQGVSCNTDTGLCEGACSHYRIGKSYIGCEYYAVVTANLLRYDFDFAVIIANASDDTATVTIEDGMLAAPRVFDVPGGGVHVEYLPWDFDLKVCEQGSMTSPCNNPPDTGVHKVKGAYHIRSTQPVTVYQFNALDYTDPQGVATSGTNDSSLLLPVNVLTGHYVVASWHPFVLANPYPSMMTIVATADNTTATVTAAAQAGAGSFGLLQAGVPQDVQLNAGDALQILSNTGDLTGSIIRADQPVAVIGGHYAANVPDSDGSQDHLEEQIFPVETLSTEYIVTAPAVPEFPRGKERYIRIIATEDDTTLTYNPPHPSAATFIAQAGDFVEIPRETGSYLVSADRKIIVAEYMEGVLAGGNMGDPSMVLSVAVDQYRTDYLFHAPNNYERNYVNVTAPLGAQVTIDGNPVTSLTPIGSSGFGVARLVLDSTGDGNHRAEGDAPFGISVYGYGYCTSYWNPGGLDLAEIPVR